MSREADALEAVAVENDKDNKDQRPRYQPESGKGEHISLNYFKTHC